MTVTAWQVSGKRAQVLDEVVFISCWNLKALCNRLFNARTVNRLQNQNQTNTHTNIFLLIKFYLKK